MEQEDESEICCTNPASFTHHINLDVDPDTGYRGENFYQCSGCGSRICEEDYASLLTWAETRMAWPRIDANTAGPLVPLCDERKVA